MFITAFPDYACQPKKKNYFFALTFFLLIRFFQVSYSVLRYVFVHFLHFHVCLHF